MWTPSLSDIGKAVFHPSAFINDKLFKSSDKFLQNFGLDLFNNAAQEKQYQIAEENNQLQREAFSFNKDLAANSYETNKDLAYNSQQIRSADMAKAGLNPLAGVNTGTSQVSASSVQAPELQAPNVVSESKFNQMMKVADMAISAKQLGSSMKLQSAQADSMKASADYQNLVNDYFSKYGVLPTQQNEWIAQAIPLFRKFGDKIPSVEDIKNVFSDLKNQKARERRAAKENAYVEKGKNDLSAGKRTTASSSYFVSQFPKNEKGWLDFKETREGKDWIQLYGWNSARKLFLEGEY